MEPADSIRSKIAMVMHALWYPGMRDLQDGRCRAVDKSASFAVNPPDLRLRGEQCISLPVLCETPLTRNLLGEHFDIPFSRT